MSKKFITKKTIVTGFLTALMTLGSASPFWDLPSQELDSLLGTNFSVTIYAADLSQFKDTIPQWATNDVSYLVDKGIIKGYDDGTFRANNTMTKVEFLTAVVRSLKTDAEIDAIIAEAKKPITEEGFTYVEYDDYISELNGVYAELGINQKAEDFWGTPYLFVAHKLDISTGVFTTIATADRGVNKELGYNQATTREEACHIMYNACTKVNKENLPDLKGVQNIINDGNTININYATSVERCVSNGLIAGIDDQYTIAAKQTLTRAQACAIIARITDNSRRLPAPVVPEDKQQWTPSTSQSGKMITKKNPVTGEEKTMTAQEWGKFFETTQPSYAGNKNGEYSKDGWWYWDSIINEWLSL